MDFIGKEGKEIYRKLEALAQSSISFAIFHRPMTTGFHFQLKTYYLSNYGDVIWEMWTNSFTLGAEALWHQAKLKFPDAPCFKTRELKLIPGEKHD